MVNEIIVHNIRVFSNELRRLERLRVQPAEKTTALLIHLRRFEKAKPLSERCSPFWIQVLVERAREDPNLDPKLKEKLKSPEEKPKSKEDGKGDYIDVYA